MGWTVSSVFYLQICYLIFYSKTVLFVDRSTKRIIVILAGHGGDHTLLSNFSAAEQHLRSAQENTRFSLKAKNHRRGTYETLTYGYSYGGGQKVLFNFL